MPSLELSDKLGGVGEERLSQEILYGQKQLSNQLKVQGIFNLFYNSQRKKILVQITAD